jgi:hypothetical protein
MKKLLTLIIASCMVLGSLGTASAVDMKVNGQWWFQYGYYSNNTLTTKNYSASNADRIRARQRLRTQFQFIADENLKAMLNLETSMHWGADSNGGGLDADEAYATVKHAYLDWTIPDTKTQIRMGMQGIRMPFINFGNPIMNADVAGVTVSSQMTPKLGLTVFWARPYDTDYFGKTQQKGRNLVDEMDIFGLMLPIKTDVVRAIPWGMVALIGKDADYWGSNGNYFKPGTAGAFTSNYAGRGRVVDHYEINNSSIGWWAGTTFELPMLDPFFLKIDAMMGGLETGKSYYDSFGYFVAANIGYKLSFGALSAISWYSSGDSNDSNRGIMPIISDDGGFFPTRYGTAGTNARSFDRLLTGTGLGMWGIGLQLANVSFVDNLSHTARVVFMGGTNEGDAVQRNNISSAATIKGDSVFNGGYFMTSDRAWEINLLNQYKVSQNLKFDIDIAYVRLDLGDHWIEKEFTKASLATMLGVTYSF